MQVAWYTGAAAETNTTPTPSAAPKRTPAVGDTDMDSIAQTVHSDSQDAPLSPGVQEEEVASGWGDGDEDGMGML